MLPWSGCSRLASLAQDPLDTELLLSDEVLWKAQQEDLEVVALYNAILEEGEKTPSATTKLGILEDKVYRVLELPHRTLYQVYVPTSLHAQLLHFFHADPLSGHLGRFKTYRRLHSLVYWPNLS